MFRFGLRARIWRHWGDLRPAAQVFGPRGWLPPGPPAQLPLMVRREEPEWCGPAPAVLPGLSLLAPCPFPINYGVAVADAGPATEEEGSWGIKVAYGWAGCR